MPSGDGSVAFDLEADGANEDGDSSRESTSIASSGAESGFEPGVVLVDFASGVTAEQAIESFAADESLAGVSVKEQMSFCTELALPDTLSVEDAVELLSASEMVSTVEPNYYLSVADDVLETGADQPAATDQSAAIDASSARKLATASIDPASTLGVSSIQPGTLITPVDVQEELTPNDTHYKDQWGLPSVKAPQAWGTVPDPQTAAEAVVVAVADNGFDLSNPDFNIVNQSNPKDLANDVVYPYDASTKQEVGYSDVAYPDSKASTADHGTHVAGIVAAHANNAKGVAGSVYNKCKLLPIRLADSNGEMSTLSLSNAMEYAISAKNAGLNVRVINMSIGVNARLSGETLQRAINETTSAGIVIVAAACNKGDGFPTLPCEAYPSDYDNVVSVINLGQDSANEDEVKRETGSNYNTASQMAKDISAPGTDIVSTSFSNRLYQGDSGYIKKSGTSMASPLVAGVLGLVFAADPTLTAEQATSKLYSSARDLTHVSGASSGWDRVTGYGEVDASAAVSAATPYISGVTVMGAGSSEAFTVMANGATASGYTWSTSDASVATVDPVTGEVTAVGGGEAIIKATDSADPARVAQQTVKVYGISGDDEVLVGLSAKYGINPGHSYSWVWSVTAPDGSATSYASINRATGVLAAASPSTFDTSQAVTVVAQSANDPSLIVKRDITILSNEITDSNTTVTFDAVTYNGYYQRPVPTVVELNTTLEYNKHFTVEWANNLNAGTAQATIKALSPLTGTLTKTFTISKAPMTQANITLSATTFAFESNSKKQAPTLVAVNDIGQNSRRQYYPGQCTYATTPVALGSSTVRITASSSCQNFTGTAIRSFTVFASWQPMYRVYNPNSGEHFYTASASERKHLVSVGWQAEGIGWYAPTTGENVYRLYNANAGDHHYTLSTDERRYLLSIGWRDEGIGWKSGGSSPLYREYNPNAKTGTHNYTTSLDEHNYLCRIGWRGEGISWYGR